MKIFYCSLLHILCLAAKAQAIDIDASLKKCLSENYANATQVNCVINARHSWDAEMNTHYKTLIKNLSATAKQKLMTAQKAWINYRDAEYKLISEYYYRVKEGTMFYVIAEDKKMEIVKKRANELKDYVQLLKY